MKQKLTILIIITLIIRVILIYTVNPNLTLTPDEEHNYTIALNNQNGLGYVAYAPEVDKVRQTAFHGSFPAFISEFIIRNNISKEAYVAFIYAITLILFAFSVPCFYKLNLSFLKSEKVAFWSAVTYCFYPSIIHFIGSLLFYENMVASLIVIVMYRLHCSLKMELVTSDFIIIPAAICISCLLRPQVIVVFLFIFIAFFLLKKSGKSFSLFLITAIMVFLANIPGLIKNKKMFGEYVMSTQSGYEFLQGHNPYAKGSWIGRWQYEDSDLYWYARKEIKNITELNELEESKARMQLGVNWIKENPGKELKLIVRKLLIYFTPANLRILPFSEMINPINLMTHLFFIAAIVLMLAKRNITREKLFYLMPILASLVLSIVFFVGYRWRYYAEPFMIIFAWSFISAIGGRKVNG